jgi:hypothetical protein
MGRTYIRQQSVDSNSFKARRTGLLTTGVTMAGSDVAMGVGLGMTVGTLGASAGTLGAGVQILGPAAGTLDAGGAGMLGAVLDATAGGLIWKVQILSAKVRSNLHK